MEEADKLCDRIGIIDRSKIIALDTPENLKSKLEGETIIIESNNNKLLSQKVKEGNLADNVMETEKELILTVGNAHTALARIVELAVSVGIYIYNISIREPDLDDAFMFFTGREIREGGGGKELTGMAARMRGRIK
jgi:ABC-2 type transport system ATP-binding protein